MKNIFDLTLPLHHGMQTYPTPWHPLFEDVTTGRIFAEGRVVHKITLGTHTGTHVDAPLHFIANGLTIDKVDLSVLVGPAKVLNFLHKGNESFGKIDIADVEATGVQIEKGDRLLLKTGWSKHFNSNRYYKDYPSLTEDLARWLVSKGVVMLAMDIPSPDDPRPGPVDSPVHKIFLGNGVILVEYLTNTEMLPEEFFICALPLKYQDGDAFPARVIAIIGD